MSKEKPPTPVELLTAAINRQSEIAEQQVAVFEQLVKLATPPRPEPNIGRRSDLRRMDGNNVVMHVPILQIAFKTLVPAQYIDPDALPELARITCPCGATIEVYPRSIEACHGPEGGDCPRFYLYTGESVRVANTQLLEAAALVTKRTEGVSQETA